MADDFQTQINNALDNVRDYFEELELEGQVGWGCLVLGIILLAASFVL
jgi:hypothetical protein